MDDIRLIHLADIHLGYTGNVNLVFGENDKAPGRYVREVDIEDAVRAMTLRIISLQPSADIVVIAGDLFHRVAPSPRAMRFAVRMVRRLLEHEIEVVIIDGNHETSSSLHPGNATDILHELGAHVINEDIYKVLRDGDWRTSRLQMKEKLAVHAVPYRAVQARAFVGVSPLPGYINVLLTHGRVSGMADLNSVGRASAGIPKELFYLDWHYIALGDWHIHAHQPIDDVPAYYAGSLEALTFGEAATYPPLQNDPYEMHGALDVQLTLQQRALIHTLPNDARRKLVRLLPIDADGVDSEGIMEMLRQRLDGNVSKEALVQLEVNNCSYDLRKELNHAEIDRLRAPFRRCEIHWNMKRFEPGEPGQNMGMKASLDEQWHDFLSARFGEADAQQRAWYEKQGMTRIEEARHLLISERSQVDEEGA